jgi:hypothetical protein
VELSEIESKLDAVTTDLLPELRATKVVNVAAYTDLLALADELVHQSGTLQLVPRRLVGKLWFVFTAMLIEAEYVKDSEEIANAAWDYQVRLARFFGGDL